MRGMEMLLRFFSVNRRMHNKTWIADGQVAIVGGRNVGDEYFDAARDTNFMDTDVAVLGEAVGEASRLFDAYWNSPNAIPLSALVRKPSTDLPALRRHRRPVSAHPAPSRTCRSWRNRPACAVWSSSGARSTGRRPRT